jgi:hypothetical protein
MRIIPTYASNSPKKIMFHVSLNTKPIQVKQDQLRKNGGK